MLLLVAGLMVGPSREPATAATSPITVSLTFDDSNADQLPAEQTMKSAGLHGTFYTVSGWVDQPSYLTLAQRAADRRRRQRDRRAHDPAPGPAHARPRQEQQREICNDRVNLINWGFQPTDFAYPFADADTTETAAKAVRLQQRPRPRRRARPRGRAARNCVYAETMPPPDPYYLRAPDEVDATWTLAQMKAEVTNAQSHGGGWVILTFHHICSHDRDRGLPVRSVDHADDLQSSS